MRLTIPIIAVTVLLGACSTPFTQPTQPRVVSSSPDELRVVTTPRPIPEPLEMTPYSPPRPVNEWSNVTAFRAVSSPKQPRLVVECFGGKLVVRHDDMNEQPRLTSRSVFTIDGSRPIVAIGDKDNNIAIDPESADNLAERLYLTDDNALVTVTTDDEVTTEVNLLGYRNAVRTVFRTCNY